MRRTNCDFLTGGKTIDTNDNPHAAVWEACLLHSAIFSIWLALADERRSDVMAVGTPCGLSKSAMHDDPNVKLGKHATCLRVGHLEV